jgi:opacity protein-like surface antigen
VKLFPALALLAVAQPAAAEDWTYKATFYGWFPGLSASVDTKFGTLESDSSASDALSDLDMAFMGTFAAQYGRWGFVGDLLYTDLSATKATPFGLFGEGTTDVKVTAFSGYALYRVTSDPKVSFDVGAGFRNFNVDVDVDLSPGALPAASQSLSSNWTDPLIAARLSLPINDRWFAQGFADYGGTGSGDETWQVYAGVGYAFDARWSTEIGYRYMDINKEVDDRDVSIGLSGPVLALTYSF